VSQDGTYTPGSFNTEHSWPRGDGADSEPAESDLHHLFPTDGDANNSRGSYPFGETSCTGNACDWSSGGSELGVVVGGDFLVFEVRPQRRGDIARAHFYFAVRYDMSIPDSEETFLRSWHDEDPPSVLELNRNDAIETYQSNRNPFVDRPDFVGRISDF
jgi:endonuclease I